MSPDRRQQHRKTQYGTRRGTKFRCVRLPRGRDRRHIDVSRRIKRRNARQGWRGNASSDPLVFQSDGDDVWIIGCVRGCMRESHCWVAKAYRSGGWPLAGCRWIMSSLKFEGVSRIRKLCMLVQWSYRKWFEIRSETECFPVEFSIPSCLNYSEENWTSSVANIGNLSALHIRSKLIFRGRTGTFYRLFPI